MLDAVWESVSGAPTWVWLVLAYLLFVGIKARTPSTVFLPKLWVFPVLLFVLSYEGISEGSGFVAVTYVVCLLLATFVRFQSFDRDSLVCHKETGSVTLPGSNTLLVILMSLFSIKFVFGCIEATDPLLFQELQIVEVGITALFSGYFLGKALACGVALKQK